MSSGYGCFLEDDEPEYEISTAISTIKIIPERVSQENASLGCTNTQGCGINDTCGPGTCNSSSGSLEPLCRERRDSKAQVITEYEGICGQSDLQNGETKVSSRGNPAVSQPPVPGKAGIGKTQEKCIKCKEGPAEAVANQREAVCRACLHSSLLSKFKSAINKYSLISRYDNVLLAFSGGQSSRVALEFLREIQSMAKTDAEASADRGRIAFKLSAAYIDERTATGVDVIEAEHGLEEVTKICRDSVVSGESVCLHVAPLEDGFSYYKVGQLSEEREGKVEKNSGDFLDTGSLNDDGRGDDVQEEIAQGNRHETSLPVLKRPSTSFIGDDGCVLEEDRAAEKTDLVRKADAEGKVATVRMADARDMQNVEIAGINCMSQDRFSSPSEDDMVKEMLSGAQKSNKLITLLGQVKDYTGREDLVEYLRMQVLQQVAQEHGYTKIVLGTCTSRVAAQVISATAKGRGFALPADIQYFDARWPVPVVLPLRDCVARELALHCHFARLQSVFVRKLGTLSGPRKSINTLSDEFVSSLQVENPSREHTILRTAAKLQPFSFNNSVQNDGHKQAFTSRLQKMAIEEPACDVPKDQFSLCPICRGPLAPEESNSLEALVHRLTRATEDSPSSCDGFGSMGEGNAPFSETSSRNGGGANISGQDGINVQSEWIKADFDSAVSSTCCWSCRSGVFGDVFLSDVSAAGRLMDLMPPIVRLRGIDAVTERRRQARAEIQEFLLDAEEDS